MGDVEPALPTVTSPGSAGGPRVHDPDARAPYRVLRRLRALLARPLLWRVTAVVAGLALGSLLFVAGPGSVAVLRNGPLNATDAARVPRWAETCVGATALDTRQRAFCARVDGRVVASQTKADGETHLLVLGGFHITVVEVRRGLRVPGWGARIVAVGPVIRDSLSLREVKALSLRGA